MTALHALVIADSALARVRIAGLPAVERAIRVARRIGAKRVTVIDGAAARTSLVASREPLLVIRADQLVHTPLVAPLVDAIADDGIAISVDPDGAYAGAFIATGATAEAALVALARGDTDTAFVATTAPTEVPHGEIARHAIGTLDERRAAHALLYRILVKPQDNAITRYLYRPVSLPLTRLLAKTPVTPNQISYFVGLLCLVGCWLTAHASFGYVIAGTTTLLVAAYVDCCDGEIARLKLLSSRYGAWVDTVIDELSSVGYMVALGLHCSAHFGRAYFGAFSFDPWLVAATITAVIYVWCMYCIYYNIIVAVGSANSQDYVGKFDVVPGERPNSVKLRPAAAKAIPAAESLPPLLAFAATYGPYMFRRDFLAWFVTLLAVLHLTHISFAMQIVGGLAMLPVLTLDHLRLRKLRRSIVRGGQVVESP